MRIHMIDNRIGDALHVWMPQVGRLRARADKNSIA